MQYKPAILVGWNASSEAADQRYLDSHRNEALLPIYEFLTQMPLPMTRCGLESYLWRVLDWLRVNKYPFGDGEVWLESIYIVIRGDNELVAEMEVDEEKWQIAQCTV